MDQNEIRESTEQDFKNFLALVSGTDGWSGLYDKGNIKVEAKWTEESRVKMIKVSNILDGVTLDCLYDVLSDPDYRRVWDKDMTDSYDVCKLNNNCIIGWYGAKMPSPLKYRDWCTLRTFRKTEEELMIFNHSVEHKKVPVHKNYVRSISYVTGYYGRKISSTSCKVIFLTQTDPKGKLPSWFVNFVSCKMSPRVMKKLYKKALAYDKWKQEHNPTIKPWLNPEQDSLPLLNSEDVYAPGEKESDDSDFEEIDETDFQCPSSPDYIENVTD